MILTVRSVLAGPTQLPRFWIFMYRVNPFTYIVEGFLGTTIANAPVTCADNEILHFTAPEGKSCSEYMAEYVDMAGGQLLNSAGNASTCSFCPMTDTNAFLSSINVSWDNRWRNFGLLWAYIIFNVSAATFIFWLVRVPKNKKDKK